MQKLLTIVVPVYKVERYINKCLDSCILYKADGSLDDEKMNQLEVIIVNDGTPDRSAELSREYTIRYPQTFRQIDKENGGHGSAWNVGLKEATGKYLRFLDSDDWLTNLDKLMEKLAETDADLVFTHHNTHYAVDSADFVDKSEPPYNVVQAMTLLPIHRFEMQHFYASFQRVTCKTILLKPYYPLFTEGTRYDDSILSVLPIIKGETFIVYDFVVYNYLVGREEQTVSRKNLLKYCEQHNYEYGKMYDFAIQNSTSSLKPILDALFYRAFSDTIALTLEQPYLKRKKCLKYLKSKIYKQDHYIYSKAINRYLNMPFIFAYVWDILRSIKNHKK